jgi:agmatine deiminase
MVDNYRLPAEFESQQAAYLIWPQRPDNWRDGGKPAQKALVELAKMLVEFEPITVLVNESQYSNARGALPEKVRVIEMSSDDAFIKDTGPFYVVDKDGNICVIDFSFNAWGGLLDGLYFPWDKDDQLAEKLADLDSFPIYKSEFVLEGCSIVVDGQGTLIATEDVVLSEGRNDNITKETAEKVFHDFLGTKKVIWLQKGYFMDETGGDADNMVSFIKPGEVVLTWTDDESDPQYISSHEALEILESATDAQGNKLIVHKMQIPKPLELSEAEANGVDPINGMLPRNAGQRLTASYVNYITTDRAIVMPIFDDEQDDIAKKQLQQLYPERQVLTFPAREFLTGGGGLHSMLLNVPAGQNGGNNR